MNDQNFALMEKLVDTAYIAQGQQARKNREHLIRDLLVHRALPQEPWDEATIEFFVAELAMMDSNNFIHNIGAGEREVFPCYFPSPSLPPHHSQSKTIGSYL